MMQIQIHTDKNIEGREALAAHIQGVVEQSLSRFSTRITRIEVHLGDENGAKSGTDDKRCMIEARVEHRQPSAVTHHAATLHQAVQGAAEKMRRALESSFGRVEDHR